MCACFIWHDQIPVEITDNITKELANDLLYSSSYELVRIAIVSLIVMINFAWTMIDSIKDVGEDDLCVDEDGKLKKE